MSYIVRNLVFAVYIVENKGTGLKSKFQCSGLYSDSEQAGLSLTCWQNLKSIYSQ